jgi:MFS family permease
MACLVVARVVFPVPSRLEEGGAKTARAKGFTTSYWLYMVAGTFFAAGLMSYELISYHLSSNRIVTEHWIPLFLGISTGAGVIASLVMGRLFDRIGIGIVVVGVVLTAIFPPLVFLGGFWGALAGLLFWGVGYATQDTLLKALIASVLPEGRRNLAFGLFYLGYGGGWLAGSVVAGLLYEHSRPLLIVFAMVTLLASLPLFLAGARADRRADG